MADEKPKVFSGIQPTGAEDARQLLAAASASTSQTQERGDAFFCIVDLHSISVEYDPAELRSSTLDLAAMLFAVGLDSERSTVFCQSHVTAHAEAAWLLSAVTSYGQLGRMTQFKEKSESQEFVSAALFTYPVLMAGDILLYQTDLVPIGDDQRQHLELARDVAERFNYRFGETFTRARGRVPRDRRPDHGPAGADEQDVHDLAAATQGAVCMRRPAGRDPEEVQDRRDRLRARRCRYDPTEKPGVVEPDRDHDRRHRRADRRDRAAVRRRRATAASRRPSARRSSSC